MADEIRANYEQLEQVAARFDRQSQAVSQMLQKMKGSMNNLKSGWQGRGSDSFFAEMNGVVLPASTRLQNALQEASQVTKQIVQTIKQAEEEAAAPFRRG